MLETSEKPDAGQPAPGPQQSADGLDAAVRSIVLKNFKYWWTENTQGRRAGDAISRMWNAYPFGALLMDESWAWWSVAQVMSNGPWQASEAGALQGVVVASSALGVAVLDWPDGAAKASKIIVVPYQNHSGLPGGQAQVQGNGFNVGAARAFYAEDFIRAQGFDQSELVLSCAYVHCELTRSIQWQATCKGQQPGAGVSAGAGADTANAVHAFAPEDQTSSGMPAHVDQAAMPAVSGYRSRRASPAKAHGVLSRSHERQQCA